MKKLPALPLGFVLLATILPAAPLAIERQALVGPQSVMFVPEGYSAATTPSLALVTPPEASASLPADWAIVPDFFIEGDEAGVTIDVPAGSSLYGTGEVMGPLLRNEQAIELWNTDNYTYEVADGKRLYQSHPWVLGVRPDGSAFGLLFDTTWWAELTTDSDQIHFDTRGAPFRTFVIDRASPQAVLRGLAELTGTTPLPPKWALGFQQCRYSYYPDARVREIADEFRARELPCDVIWLDIHYMDGYRVFTFDPEHFPDPKATNDYLHEKNFHSVWMIDPGVKIDPGYEVYDSGNRRDVWVQTADGEDFRGDVWPGPCKFPDYTMPSAREWWADLYLDFMHQGVDGVWNDMNEPSVFETETGTMPEDNWHRGGGSLPPGPHLMYHNAYGMLMAAASRIGILQAKPDHRPFLLTRSNFLGGQRYAATWTGDNTARMEHLELSVPMSLNLSLSGQPFNGPDIGGFAGPITPELYGKWIAMAPFYPFSRAHTAVDNPDREPWVFGPEIEAVARTALERRYRLLPYLYTLFFKTSLHGDAIMQPVFFADPGDLRLRDEDEAFLLGPDLLVIPQWSESPELPSGIWREVNLLDATKENDGYQATVKLRGGAIVPLGEVVQHTGEASLDPLTLLVCLDENGYASGELYEDAGDGFAYRNGEYAHTRYIATRANGTVRITIERRNGSMEIPERKIRVRLLTENGEVSGMGMEPNGMVLELP